MRLICLHPGIRADFRPCRSAPKPPPTGLVPILTTGPMWAFGVIMKKTQIAPGKTGGAANLSSVGKRQRSSSLYPSEQSRTPDPKDLQEHHAPELERQLLRR